MMNTTRNPPESASIPRGLTTKLTQRVCAVLAPHDEVLEAYLFGSEAAGIARAHSDVDIAVYVDEQKAAHGPYGYQAELCTELIAALQRNDIDLVVLNHAPPLLYHRVLRDGQRVFSRDIMATTTREGYALSRYCDYLPQLAKIEAARKAARQSSP